MPKIIEPFAGLADAYRTAPKYFLRSIEVTLFAFPASMLFDFVADLTGAFYFQMLRE